MNWKTIGLATLLADFTAFSGWVVYEHGYVGLFAAIATNAATMQIGLDLVIALSMVAVWMSRDARARGVSATPYLLLTAFAGSIGPLLYLVLRDRLGATETRRLRATTA